MNKFKWWAKSCLRKTRYDSKHFALKVAKDIKQERGTDLRVYWCEECGGHHLTSKIKES